MKHLQCISNWYNSIQSIRLFLILLVSLLLICKRWDYLQVRIGKVDFVQTVFAHVQQTSDSQITKGTENVERGKFS